VPGEDVVEVLAVGEGGQRQTEREFFLALLVKLLHDALAPGVGDFQRAHDVRQVGALQKQLHDEHSLFCVRAVDGRPNPALVRACVLVGVQVDVRAIEIRRTPRRRVARTRALFAVAPVRALFVALVSARCTVAAHAFVHPREFPVLRARVV
jgi:hypothetical protein